MLQLQCVLMFSSIEQMAAGCDTRASLYKLLQGRLSPTYSSAAHYSISSQYDPATRLSFSTHTCQHTRRAREHTIETQQQQFFFFFEHYTGVAVICFLDFQTRLLF